MRPTYASRRNFPSHAAYGVAGMMITTEFGRSPYDLHATILHLLGIDHERLTFYHNGIQRRLTNVHDTS